MGFICANIHILGHVNLELHAMTEGNTDTDRKKKCQFPGNNLSNI